MYQLNPVQLHNFSSQLLTQWCVWLLVMTVTLGCSGCNGQFQCGFPIVYYEQCTVVLCQLLVASKGPNKSEIERLAKEAIADYPKRSRFKNALKSTKSIYNLFCFASSEFLTVLIITKSSVSCNMTPCMQVPI